MRENVRVSTTILNKVRSKIKKTKQTVGGFYDLAVQEKLLRDSQAPRLYISTNEYSAIKQSNKKK